MTRQASFQAVMKPAIADAQDRLRSSYRELEQTNRQLSKANASLSKSNLELERFAYIASRDLQEPTRMVASFTDRLRSRYQGRLDTQGLRYLQFAHAGSLRLKRIITGLLPFPKSRRFFMQRTLGLSGRLPAKYRLPLRV